MKKAALLVLSLLLVASAPTSTLPDPQSLAAEFPPQDYAILSLERRGFDANLAARRIAEDATGVEALRALARAQDFDRAFTALRAIVDRQPRRIPDAFEAMGDALWRFRGNDEKAVRRTAELKQIVADARRILPTLPREDAARAARLFLSVDGEFDPNSRRAAHERLTRFIEEYRGTETAVLAEVDALMPHETMTVDYRANLQGHIDSLHAFAQEHPGTAAGAKALYYEGTEWHGGNTLGILEPRGADPTNRFMRVLAIAKELESGRYPPSEWVKKAPDLVIGFYMPDDSTIPPENVDRLIAGYLEFVRTHLAVDEGHTAQNGVGYIVTSKLAKLFGRKGEPEREAVDRVLSDLERGAPDPPAIRYLRADYYIRNPGKESPAEHRVWVGKAKAALTTLSAEGQGLFHRKALATLASLEFQDREYTSARSHFRKYADSYPQSGWTWLARVRAGQCDNALGDTHAATTAYLDVARLHPDLPLAVVLGHEYAALAYESGGDFEKAVVEHQRALAAWDNDFGLRYTTFISQSTEPGDPFLPRTDTFEVTKISLAPRIAELKRSLSLPGGARLERGRVLLLRKRHSEALTELRRLSEQYPKSGLVPQARELAHRARLERALQRADVERPDADERAAIEELDALVTESNDFAVTAAKIARASLLWKQGNAPAAEVAMSRALTEWHARQRTSTPATDLEKDVAEIRRAIFLPRGGALYGADRWNAFTFPAAPAPFLLVNADVTVKRPDDDPVRVSLVQAFGGDDKALFFDSGEIDFLEQMIYRLGGTRRREPKQIMATPNQPVGDSMQILRLWNKFFHARPGHWGGWEIETYPVITEIEFTNPERTKAAAKVTIGYSGATVELEKEAGKWVAKRLTNQWVT